MDNKIYFGDNLKILKKLPSESVDLIYIDPPFNTKKTQKRTTIRTIQDPGGDRKGFKGNTYRTIKVGTQEYDDNFDAYIDGFLRPRLREAYRILKPTGSLYFHIDYREAHYCKLLLDHIFGREGFLNEIIWAYDYGGRPRSKWPAKHDNILFYAKNPRNYVFNREDIDKEPYMAPGLVGPEKAEKGKMPTDTWWALYTGTNEPKSPSDTWWIHFARNRYQTDVWVASKRQPTGQNDIWWQTIIPTGSKERLGYPTQKPRKLIDRIVKASSYEGDVVLDFFAGSGTVGESCLELNRNFILIDNNKSALEVMAKRFSGASNIQWIDFDPNPFQTKDTKPETQKPQQPKQKMSSEFIMLAGVANHLQEALGESNDLWEYSPFEWVLHLSPRQKGKLAGDLIRYWLNSKGLQLDPVKDSSEMISLNGLRFAIKFSTLWTNGIYKFQQIRPKGFDYLICLGISPFDAHCWVFERKYAIMHATPQHKSAKGAEYWMAVHPNEPEEWITIHGGTLDQAYKVLKNLTRR